MVAEGRERAAPERTARPLHGERVRVAPRRHPEARKDIRHCGRAVRLLELQAVRPGEDGLARARGGGNGEDGKDVRAGVHVERDGPGRRERGEEVADHAVGLRGGRREAAPRRFGERDGVAEVDEREAERRARPVRLDGRAFRRCAVGLAARHAEARRRLGDGDAVGAEDVQRHVHVAARGERRRERDFGIAREERQREEEPAHELRRHVARQVEDARLHAGVVQLGTRREPPAHDPFDRPPERRRDGPQQAPRRAAFAAVERRLPRRERGEASLRRPDVIAVRRIGRERGGAAREELRDEDAVGVRLRNGDAQFARAQAGFKAGHAVSSTRGSATASSSSSPKRRFVRSTSSAGTKTTRADGVTERMR